MDEPTPIGPVDSENTRRLKRVERRLDELIEAIQGDEMRGKMGLAAMIHRSNAVLFEKGTGHVDRLRAIEEGRAGERNVFLGGWKTLCLIGGGLGGLLTMLYTVLKDFVIPHKP